MGEAWRRIKEHAYRLLPLEPLRKAIPREVIGLTYHVVSDRPLPHVRHLFRHKTTAQFEQDLLFLQREFHLLSYAELAAGRDGKGQIPPRSVLVTFDDGYADCFSVVRPLLLRHGVPCIFFVITDFIDNRRVFGRNVVSLCIYQLQQLGPADQRTALRDMAERFASAPTEPRRFARWLRARQRTPAEIDLAAAVLGIDAESWARERQPFMTAAQVQTLAADGFTIGAHTCSHSELGRLGDDALVTAEIVDSCRAVRGWVGTDSVPFAFPFHGSGVDRDLLARIRAENPFVGLMFDSGKLRQDREFIVHRIAADRPPPGESFGSTLPNRLRAAYLKQIGQNIRGFVTGGSECAEEFRT